MKILFVCQQYIHSARWISQLKSSHHEIYVFDCLDRPIHKDLRWTNYTENWSKRKIPYLKGEHFLKKKFPSFYAKIEPFLKVTPSEKLCQIINEIQPDLVHSLEMQSQTYHVLKANRKFDFKWAYFSWGSDLFFYKNDKNHSNKIKNVLGKLNYLFTDNSRDIQLAKELGFSGKNIPVFPGGGGYDLKKYQKYYQPISERKLILIKGYHHWAGRALFVLEAIQKIAHKLTNFDVYVYSAHNVVAEKIKEINKTTNLNIEYSLRTDELSHEELLEKFGKSLIAIGNNSSDGIPNTLLEAIILGAFPIQSNPGGATEDYIEDGKNGFLIQNPENADEIADKILEAINNKELLENAFEINKRKAEKLAYKTIQEQVLKIYQDIENEL